MKKLVFLLMAALAAFLVGCSSISTDLGEIYLPAGTAFAEDLVYTSGATTITYGADGSYSEQTKTWNGTDDVWELDSGDKGTYTYDSTTKVLSITYTQYYVAATEEWEDYDFTLAAFALATKTLARTGVVTSKYPFLSCAVSGDAGSVAQIIYTLGSDLVATITQTSVTEVENGVNIVGSTGSTKIVLADETGVDMVGAELYSENVVNATLPDGALAAEGTVVTLDRTRTMLKTKVLATADGIYFLAFMGSGSDAYATSQIVHGSDSWSEYFTDNYYTATAILAGGGDVDAIALLQRRGYAMGALDILMTIAGQPAGYAALTSKTMSDEYVSNTTTFVNMGEYAVSLDGVVSAFQRVTK